MRQHNNPPAVIVTGVTLENLTTDGPPDFDADQPAQVWEVRHDARTGSHSQRLLSAGHSFPAACRAAADAPNRNPAPVVAVGVTVTGTVWITDATLDKLCDPDNPTDATPYDDAADPDAYPHRAVKVVTYAPHNDAAEGYIIERADGSPSPVIVAEVTPKTDDDTHPYLSALLAHRRTTTSQARAVKDHLRDIAHRLDLDPDNPADAAALMARIVTADIPDEIRDELERMTFDAMTAADCPPIQDPDDADD